MKNMLYNCKNLLWRNDMNLFEYIDLLDKPYDIFITKSNYAPMHWHYYSEILYIRKGRLRLICNERSYILEEHDLCYIYPLQLHEIQLISDDAEHAVIKFDIHTVHIPEAFLWRIYAYFVQKTSCNDDCILIKNIKLLHPGLPALIYRTVAEIDNPSELSTLQIQANLFSILIAIVRSSNKEIEVKEKEHTDTTLSFHHILEYIDLHSSEPLEVQKLANMCNLSYSHFAKLFREHFGQSCKEYITYIRLNKADELLMHTNYDISYIATETGFFDGSHFIHAYKKWKGITPKQRRLF